MKTSKKQKDLWQIATCVALSTFYFAMLAYPFGVTGGGYVVERVLIAGAIFFAISIPAWIVNIKREFLDESTAAEQQAAAQAEPVREKMNIGQIAVLNKWFNPDEVKQILYCQEYDGMSFGKVAVKRNFLTMTQVKALLKMQAGTDKVIQPHKI